MNQPFFGDDFFSFVEEAALVSEVDLTSLLLVDESAAGVAEEDSLLAELLYPSLR